jgi:hypothetical protein
MRPDAAISESLHGTATLGKAEMSTGMSNATTLDQRQRADDRAGRRRASRTTSQPEKMCGL